MGLGIDILNNIRANASTEYAETIPEATRNNFAEIGTYLENYDLLYNEFHAALFNKIGKTIIEEAICRNRLEMFKAGKAKPLDIESIYIDLAKGAYTFDPEGKNALARITDDNVKAVFHRMNRQDCYDLTIGDLDFDRVFRSEATFETFVTAKLNGVYNRAIYDEWVFMKNTLATYDGYFRVQVQPITAANAAETAKDFVKRVRKLALDVSFDTRLYNKQEVMTHTDEKNLVLLLHKDILAEIDVEVLAKAFNMGKTKINLEIVAMDNFGTRAGTYALMIDKEFYKAYDTKSHMEPQRNAKGLFTNWFYHVHQIHTLNPFKNSVEFTTEEVAA